MKRHVNALAARKNLGELLESVYYRGDEIVVERAGKPMAVLIPLHQYERLEQQKEEIRKTLEAIWANRPPIKDPEAEEEFILNEVMEMRREKQAQRQRGGK
jgi:prevent-host-death family protein